MGEKIELPIGEARGESESEREMAREEGVSGDIPTNDIRERTAPQDRDVVTMQGETGTVDGWERAPFRIELVGPTIQLERVNVEEERRRLRERVGLAYDEGIEEERDERARQRRATRRRAEILEKARAAKASKKKRNV